MPLQVAIKAVAGQWPTYGYRRITRQLRRQGWFVKHKLVERIMRDLRLHYTARLQAVGVQIGMAEVGAA